MAATALIAAISVVIGAMTFFLQFQQWNAQHAAEQSARFSAAVERLENDSLAIRMAGLFELQQLGLDEPEFQERIVRILGPFIREGIENREHLPPVFDEFEWSLPRPHDDVFLAAEITSFFWRPPTRLFEHRFAINLMGLQAENLDLHEIQLRGATLVGANLQGTNLNGANLQDAELNRANLQGAWLAGVDLTVGQLLGVRIDEDTRLSQ